MRHNFALASANVINNIRADLLMDESLKQEFCDLLPNPTSCGTLLWELFVKRVSNLHGTECAAQMMDNLASMRRKAAAHRKSRQNAKYEQLRQAKRQKKIIRLTQDLTVPMDAVPMDAMDAVPMDAVPMDAVAMDAVATEPGSEPLDLDYGVGDKVTVNEGTGSATKQWSGVVVEIDCVCQLYIICCQGVDSRPNGYNMAVPFQESSSRINQPIVGKSRKRTRKIFTDCV